MIEITEEYMSQPKTVRQSHLDLNGIIQKKQNINLI